MKLHDISMVLQHGMIVYPNNPNFSIKGISSIPKNSSNVSEMAIGTHTGTHVDSWLHISNTGKGVDKIPLEHFYGECYVLDLTAVNFGDGIESKHLAKYKFKKGEIALLKTKNSGTGFKEFKQDFVYLTEDGAEHFVRAGIKTIGIDYLSVQKFRTGYCASHCVLLNNNIIIFEGLDLSKVKEGHYIFAGLPLKVKDGDGAPARAILIENS